VPVLLERGDRRTPSMRSGWRLMAQRSTTTVASLLMYIRSRLRITPADALFLIEQTSGTLLSGSTPMVELEANFVRPHRAHPERDGFLCLSYSVESAFGHPPPHL
jgi:hypothetical protein